MKIGLSAALIVVAISGLISVAIILAIRPLLTRYAMAKPNSRSSHATPIPQGGGIAVVAALVVVTAAAATLGDEPTGSGLWLVLAATGMLAVVGAVDDFYEIGVAPRFVFQALAIVAVVATFPADLRIAPFFPLAIERTLLFVSLLWFVNLANFMDGIDWMTVAEVVPVSAALAVLGQMGALPPEGTLVALAILGATIGFAPFNRPVARLFLGDVGSLPIGLVLGWLLATLAGAGHLAAALLLPLYYVADATLTLVHRGLRGKSVLQAHRDHFYQRATDHGLPVLWVVGHVFGVNVALAALALVAVRFDSVAVDLGVLAVGAVIVGWLVFRFQRAR